MPRTNITYVHTCIAVCFDKLYACKCHLGDNLANSLEPDQDKLNVWLWIHMLIGPLMVLLNLFKIIMIVKNNQETTISIND